MTWKRLLKNRFSTSHQNGAYLPGLIWTIIRTDFKTRYHGTWGGYLWALVKPFSMFVVLYTVFSVIFSMDPNYNLNLIIGLFLWDFFSEATKTGFLSLQAKTFLLTKTKFPAWIVVLTSASSALITVIIFGIAACAYISIFRRSLSFFEISCFGFYIFLFLVIIIGISLAGSVLFLRYRDINQIWDLLIQAGFFFTPIIYPLDIVPHKFHFYLYAWLPTAVIQFSRSVLVKGEIPTIAAHLLLLGGAMMVLFVGAALYWRLAPRSLERL
jgi:lipopolysaccharide transport system permease protein